MTKNLADEEARKTLVSMVYWKREEMPDLHWEISHGPSKGGECGRRSVGFLWKEYGSLVSSPLFPLLGSSEWGTFGRGIPLSKPLQTTVVIKLLIYWGRWLIQLGDGDLVRPAALLTSLHCSQHLFPHSIAHPFISFSFSLAALRPQADI